MIKYGDRIPDDHFEEEQEEEEDDGIESAELDTKEIAVKYYGDRDDGFPERRYTFTVQSLTTDLGTVLLPRYKEHWAGNFWRQDFRFGEKPEHRIPRPVLEVAVKHSPVDSIDDVVDWRELSKKHGESKYNDS